MKTQITTIFLAIILLAACVPPQAIPVDTQNTAMAIVGKDIVLTRTAMPTAALPPSTFTPTATLVFPTPSPLPTQLPIFIITPDAIQVERWGEYQTELAKLILSQEGTVFPFYEQSICEWDILGRTRQEVYVWAVCSGPGTLGEKPALIYLEIDGSIRDVKVVFPGYSWDSQVQELFPKNIQEKIYLYASSSPFSGRPLDMREHLGYRQTHSEEPPLIILSATP